MSRISFIGIGNMGTAMALAALKTTPAEDVFVSDGVREKAEDFCREHGGTAVTDNVTAAENGTYIVVSVKAYILPDVLKEIAPVLKSAVENKERKVLVPIAAGVFLKDFREILGDEIVGGIPIVRVLPTVYAFLGCGLMSCAVGNEMSKKAFDEISEILKPSGTFELMDEKMVDLASTASGCTPAFTAMFIEALADGMVMMGMPRDKAMEYCARGVYGGAAMVLEKERHPGQIKDAVCSPGGSTIVGVNTLERNGFRYAAMEAVHQAALKILGK